MHTHTRESLIAFEDRIKAHWEAGNLPSLTHLCGGNETQLLEIFSHIRPGDWVFSTHRNHYHALLCGYPAAELEQAILDGRSMFSFRKAKDISQEAAEIAEKNLRSETSASSAPSCNNLLWDGMHLYSSAILAGQCGIAAGVAYACQWHLHPAAHLAPKVYCFLGDGAEEEGHFYEAALFVEAHNLPCTFIIEDNQRQVDTDKATRRGVNMQGPSAWRPLDHFKCVRRYYYTPTYPHAGSGCKFQIKFQPAAIERMKAA